MDEFNKALNYAFLILKYRLRSRNEIIFRLKRKKFNSDVINKVIAYLEKHHYINDTEFCRLYVASLLEKGYGSKRIEFNLNRLGLSRDLIEKFLENQPYQEKLNTLIEKKLIFYKNKKNMKQKILRFLLQRGYSYDEIIKGMENFGLNYEDR